MNNHQLLSRVQELQKQLSAMRQVFSRIENLSEDAFSGFEDQWPDTLESELDVLQRMFRRFQEAELKDDFLDLLVAGRPLVAELAVDAEAVAKKAANGFLSAIDTLNHEDTPSSGFTSWHWFEHAFHDFLTRQSRVLSAAKEFIQLEMDSGDSESNDISRSGYRNL